LNLFAIDWNNSGVIFDLDEKRKRLKEIEGIISKEGFWDTPEETRDILRFKRSQKHFMGWRMPLVE
jgi:hypothetical protein